MRWKWPRIQIFVFKKNRDAVQNKHNCRNRAFCALEFRLIKRRSQSSRKINSGLIHCKQYRSTTKEFSLNVTQPILAVHHAWSMRMFQLKNQMFSMHDKTFRRLYGEDKRWNFGDRLFVWSGLTLWLTGLLFISGAQKTLNHVNVTCTVCTFCCSTSSESSAHDSNFATKVVIFQWVHGDLGGC